MATSGGSFIALSAEATPEFRIPLAQLDNIKTSSESTTTEIPQPSIQATIDPLLPPSQTVLLLHGVRRQYEVTDGYAIPGTQHDHELLVQTTTIGLNPIDWKSP